LLLIERMKKANAMVGITMAAGNQKDGIAIISYRYVAAFTASGTLGSARRCRLPSSIVGERAGMVMMIGIYRSPA
jgi:hypothetical protein